MTARTRSNDQGMIFFLVAVGSLTDFALQGFFGSSPSSAAAPRMLERTSKAMLLDIALTAAAYAMHWHRAREHAQQQAAAEQTLIHLQAAYAPDRS